MTELYDLALADLIAIKARQQQTWASGDFGVVAARNVLVSEELCEAADLHAGSHVLDVATGSGNAALAAARRGCTVIGIDYVPALLARGRKRAAVERLDVEFIEGDAESLPFPNESFDVVTSVFGAMFAPDHVKTAAELIRVVRPGGTIALASWTPDGFVGDLFRVIARHLPPPVGLASPMLWGTESHLRQLFGPAISGLATEERTHAIRFRSAEEFVAFYRRWYGPTVQAFAAVEGPARDALEGDVLELLHRSNRLANGALTVPATYLQAIATC
jgi:ubiquinone/menaquinone biosynthesis C-methylase UbiE